MINTLQNGDRMNKVYPLEHPHIIAPDKIAKEFTIKSEKCREKYLKELDKMEKRYYQLKKQYNKEIVKIFREVRKKYQKP